MEIKVSAVSQSSLSLTKKMYDCLYDLASYKHTDRGFSFFIRKDYLEGFLHDIEEDRKNYPDYDYLSNEEIELLNKLLSLYGENKLLLIDNDDLMTK